MATPVPPGPARPPSPSAVEFERWLVAARGGSLDDLGRVLDACRGYLHALADGELGSTIRPKAGASDVVQDSLIDAQKGFDGFRGRSRDEFLAWVRQILQHNLTDLARKYREVAARRVDREEPFDPGTTFGHRLVDSGTPPDGRAARAEEEDALRRAVARLPAAYQKVLALRYRDGRNWDEVGAALARTPGAARKLWFRAVERLKLEMTPRHDLSPPPV
jgi:RNA polymerase sigma-70 factor (ECF subfamily)